MLAITIQLSETSLIKLKEQAQVLASVVWVEKLGRLRSQGEMVGNASLLPTLQA